MADQGDAGGIIRLSTDALDERSRAEVWRETVGLAVMSVEIDALSDSGRYYANLAVRPLPGLVFTEGVHAGMRYERTRPLIDSDDLVLSLAREGGHVVRQLGREFELAAGEAVLTSSADPGLSYNAAPEHLAVFRIPQDRVRSLVGDVGAALARPIDRNIPALKMLLGYSNVLSTLPPDAPGDLQHVMATHVCDLVALVLGATREAAQTAAGRGVRAARLHAIKREIAENLERPELTADRVAANQRISTSYLRKLFESDGTTFGDFVRQQRLARAYRLLTDPRFAALKISAIAFDVGFSDLSYFNRAFRRQYGCTPSEARAAP